MNFSKIVFTSAIALLITSAGFTQVKKKPAASSKSKPATANTQLKPATLPTDPDVVIGKLPNGFTYYIRNNSQPEHFATLMLVNKAGSVLEADGQQGAAHFVEHMAFTGTRNFSKTEIANYLKSRGVGYAADRSASAAFDETVYQLSLPTDTVAIFEKGFKLLADWAGNITFDATDIENERAKIVNEANTTSSNEQTRLDKQTLPIYLKNSRYALRLPLPSADVFKKITPEAVKSFYHDWYRPDLQAIVVVGDFDVKLVEKLIKDNFSSLKNPAAEKPRTLYASTPVVATTVNYIIDKGLTYDQVQIVSTQPQKNVKTVADYSQDLKLNLFNQMLGVRINDVINQRNNQLLGAQVTYGPFYGRQDAFTIIAATKPGALETGVKAVVAEVERARKFGFTLTELERSKQNMLVATGNAYQGKNNTFSINYISQYAQNFLTGSPITGIDYEYNFYTNNISKVTLADMNALAAKIISAPNRTIVVTSATEKTKLPDEATLLSWINNAGKDVTAYIDETDEPFMTKLPAAGKVASTEQDSIINITRLTLSNGVKVILKPTNFANNQVLINGYSFGGTSLASNQDMVSAMLAGKLIASSGAGDLTQDQLNKRLSSKRVSIEPYISEITQGITGNSSAADFEYAMQLLNLYFTQPRKNAAAWQDLINQTKTSLVTRATDPASAVQDTVTSILNNNNTRSLGITLKNINTADIDQAYNFYKDRFADASGFTFTFTGSFTVDQIIPFLETYLGSLPSTNKKETYKNLGLHPQPGQITKTFTVGTGDKAAIQLTYNGAYDYNEKNNLLLDALELILNLRLEAALTEKEGASSPGARVTYTKLPEGRYEINIFADVNPADAEKVMNLAQAEVAKLKQTDVEAKEIQTFVQTDAKQTKKQYKQNIFWEGYLSSSAQNQDDPHQIINRIGLLEQVTPQSIKEAANKYLSGTNLIKLTLLPQKK